MTISGKYSAEYIVKTRESKAITSTITHIYEFEAPGFPSAVNIAIERIPVITKEMSEQCPVERIEITGVYFNRKQAENLLNVRSKNSGGFSHQMNCDPLTSAISRF